MKTKKLSRKSIFSGLTRGFTLIELLVVIAIIGILSSVVLASLNTARAKGADAAIKTNLSSIRSQSELYYDNNKNYGEDTSSCTAANTLFADANVTGAIASAENASTASSTCLADDGIAGAGTTATSWALSVPLKTDGTLSWCADSTGAARTITGPATLVGDVAVCP